MPPFEFLKLMLGVWYIAYAVTATDGPRGIFEWMREKLPHGRHGAPTFARGVLSDGTEYETDKIYPANGLLDCIICFAPWVALALLTVQVDVIRDVLALAGGALLLHSFTGWRYAE